MLTGKNIVVGVSGSIAAYKACEVVRFLQKKGASVRVVMTEEGAEFVGKLTFQALTQQPVFTSWKDGQTGLEHITLARWADCFLIAPATANTIAKIRFGLADDFLTSMALAYDKPIVFAPAMNTKMLENQSTTENIEVLKERGHIFVQPAEGLLACGEEGAGKLAELEDIYLEVLKALTPQKLKGKKVVVTAGATREFFDPIRYVSNASSGQMGYHLAKMSYVFGADTVLISAPVCITAPSQIKVIKVVSALDMYEKVLKEFKDASVLIMNAAVADFRPKEISHQKLKKDREPPTVEMEPNPDILKEVGRVKRENQMVVGFAAESQNIIENATDKIKRKNIDMIVANPVTVFSRDSYNGYIIYKDGKTNQIENCSKEEAAYLILDEITKILGT